MGWNVQSDGELLQLVETMERTCEVSVYNFDHVTVLKQVCQRSVDLSINPAVHHLNIDSGILVAYLNGNDISYDLIYFKKIYITLCQC